MKKLPKKIKTLALALIIGGVSVSTIVLADGIGIIKINDKTTTLNANKNVNSMGDKIISDIHKVWTIRFNYSIDTNSFADSIQVKDTTDGSIQQVDTVAGEDDNSVKINAPAQGYKVGHSYQVTVNNNVKSKKGKNLNRSGLMNFKVVDVEKGNYTASVKVVVSPILPILKQITINSLNFPEIKTIKVNSGNKVFNMGETIVTATNESAVTLYFYSGDGKTIIAKGQVDVSQSEDDITVKLENEN